MKIILLLLPIAMSAFGQVITVDSVTGLRQELDARMTTAPGLVPGRVVVTDANGLLTSSNGQPGQCVQVDGTPGPCTANWVDAEVPTGTMDGINLQFTLSLTPSPSSSLQLYLNGILQKASIDYNLVGNVITFQNGVVPKVLDIVQAFYRTQQQTTATGRSLSSSTGRSVSNAEASRVERAKLMGSLVDHAVDLLIARPARKPESSVTPIPSIQEPPPSSSITSTISPRNMSEHPALQLQAHRLISPGPPAGEDQRTWAADLSLRGQVISRQPERIPALLPTNTARAEVKSLDETRNVVDERPGSVSSSSLPERPVPANIGLRVPAKPEERSPTEELRSIQGLVKILQTSNPTVRSTSYRLPAAKRLNSDRSKYSNQNTLRRDLCEDGRFESFRTLQKRINCR
jgi:hypothetical protein